MELDIHKVLANYKEKLADANEKIIMLEVENRQLKDMLADKEKVE